jgi:hypothetical protein
MNDSWMKRAHFSRSSRGLLKDRKVHFLTAISKGPLIEFKPHLASFLNF